MLRTVKPNLVVEESEPPLRTTARNPSSAAREVGKACISSHDALAVPPAIHVPSVVPSHRCRCTLGTSWTKRRRRLPATSKSSGGGSTRRSSGNSVSRLPLYCPYDQ